MKRETSSRPLFVFQKSFVLGKSKWSAAWFHYISIALKLAYNRNKLFKTLPYWSIDMLNFDFLDKGLGIVSRAHFVYDFSTKIFLMLYSINWRQQKITLIILNTELYEYACCLWIFYCFFIFSIVLTYLFCKANCILQTGPPTPKPLYYWHFNFWKQKKFAAAFLWIGFNRLKVVRPLREYSLLLTNKFLRFPSTHLIDLWRM